MSESERERERESEREIITWKNDFLTIVKVSLIVEGREGSWEET